MAATLVSDWQSGTVEILYFTPESVNNSPKRKKNTYKYLDKD